MDNGFFLITGTSKGIGEALAIKVVENENYVLGVSRSQSETLKSSKYHHLSFDLNETSRIDHIMERVNEIVDHQHFDFVCLVNNASAVEPLKSIDKSSPTEIESHVRIGLIAPMILTSMFIRKFSDATVRKKVAFISSGSAFIATPGGSVYCSSKAAINMFAQCVGLEQQDRDHAFEVVAIGPGMVDTPMQRITRSKTSDEFASVDFFKQAFEEGKLQHPSKVADKIYHILEGKYQYGKYINVSDV